MLKFLKKNAHQKIVTEGPSVQEFLNDTTP